MQAIGYTEYGPVDVLQLREVEKPTPKEDEVLVRVHASSVVYGDLAMVRGRPFVVRLSSGLRKPKHLIPGIDVAGRVEAVGDNVKRFRPGDEVFGDMGGCGFGAYAEYVSAAEDALAHKPASATFAEAAAVPQAALVALQALRDAGQIQPGQQVLVNGASGGNGTFAVQIAKSYGAEVTAVCSTRNLDMVRSIGADHVFDYTQEDFTQAGERYHLILDIVANQPVSYYFRALRPAGAYVAIPFSASALFQGPFVPKAGGKKAIQFSHKPSVEDLDVMGGLLETGKVVPVIDRCFPLHQTAEALRYYAERHASGKVIITVASNEKA